jgi:CheY-like chemotaxis protein/signal transduction histidine kinase
MGKRLNNLSFRLPAFILLASLVPLAGFGLFAISHTEKTLLATQARATLRTATLTAGLVEEKLQDSLLVLQTDSENLDLLALSPDDQEWALLTMLRQHPAFTELTLLDANGQEKVRVAKDKVFLPEDLTSQAGTPPIKAIQTGKTFFGEAVKHEDQQALAGYTSHIGCPLIDPATQTVAGILMVDLNLHKIFNNLSNINIGKQGGVYVVDQHGKLLTNANFSLVLSGATLPAGTLPEQFPDDGKGVVKIFTNTAGVEVQGAIVPIGSTNWRVIGERPLAGLQADLSQTNRLLQILLVGLLVALLPAVYLFTRRIVQPLQALEKGTSEIGSGHFDVSLAVQNDDEVGRVTGAFNNMALNLQQLTSERARIDWQKNGLSALSDELRGNLTVVEVAKRAACHLAQYVAAPVAALYVNDGSNVFPFAAGFAHSATKAERRKFALGQGLVGQAAAGREIMELNDIPEQYLDVTSGLGASASQALLLLPVIHNNEVIGVLELGAFQPFSNEAREFLTSAVIPLAIALHAARARESLDLALGESQRFAEELQTQQEELQSANEELEEQSQRLRASEEELQAQQEELQAANEELEETTLSLQQRQDLLNEKNLDLEANRQRLEQQALELQVASRYKSEFLANMSHELRTPLNSLLILSQDLASNRDGNLSPGQIESSEVIYNSGNDLLHLINEILDLSKIESGKMELHFDDIRLSDIQARLQKNFQHMAQAKDLDFSVVLDDEIPETLHTDHQRLDQILKNLIANALKFTTQGSVSVSIGRPQAGSHLRRMDLDPAHCCAIAVTDSGIGIPGDKLEDIFGAFQQVDGSISRQYGGTGLGLTISRELAALLGGELQVESTEGVGSTFTLYLPTKGTAVSADLATDVSKPKTLSAPILRSKPAPEAKQKPPAPAPSIADDRNQLAEGKQVILIVEDDLAFARILAELCHDKGFSYLHAGDGETGLILAETYLPAAILLDIRLPGMHGLELLEVLKSRTELRHIPVHIVSVEDRAHEALKLGAAGFLSKPTSRDELEKALGKLEEVISGRIRHLLVVEDNLEQQRSIMRLIGNGDVKSLGASSGAEALSYLLKGNIDCMILDLSLPDMTGFDLLKQLKEDPTITLPPVIVYTGRDLTSDEEARLNEYTASIIIKGVRSPERLLDETSLFLHRVVAKLPDHQQKMIAALHDNEPGLTEAKILLVDDDMRNVFALAKVLEQHGLTVIKAANGKKALEALVQEPDIDLVLMDIMMPVMDGYEAMRKIRAQSQFARLPILALTAKAMQEDRGKCIEAGASDYLSKPVDIPKLLSLLRVWLHRN